MGKRENDGKHSSEKPVKRKTRENTSREVNINDEKKRKKMNKILRIILIALIIILIVFVSIFGKYMVKSGGNITQAFKEMFKDAVGDQEPIFVLVMGISEDISAELTDTIMLIGYNPDTNQAFVLSIPRDTFIGSNESKAGGLDKINALYQKDPQKTVAAVENITGIKIDYYVTVKTSVLVKIVDTLEGVYFDVPVNMDYDDTSQDLHIHLKAGYQKLNGDQAEQLVRFRHNNDYTSYPASYGDNDEGRTRTQREFLKVVAQQILSTRDVEKIKTIAKDVIDNLETNITFDQVVGYIPYAIDFNMDDLQMQQLPGDMGIMNSLWFFKVNNQKTEDLINGYIERLGLTDAEKKVYLIEKKSTKTTTSSNTTNTTNKNTTSNSVVKNTTSNNVTSKNATTNNITNTSTNEVVNNKTTTNSSSEKNTSSEKSTKQNNETSSQSNSVDNNETISNDNIEEADTNVNSGTIDKSESKNTEKTENDSGGSGGETSETGGKSSESEN